PSGVTAVFGTNPVTTTSNTANSTLTLQTTSGTALTSGVTFTVSGSDSGSGCPGRGPSPGSATLVVQKQIVGTVSVSAQSGTPTVGTAGSATYTVTVNRNSG